MHLTCQSCDGVRSGSLKRRSLGARREPRGSSPCSMFVLMEVETLGVARSLGWKVHMRPGERLAERIYKSRRGLNDISVLPKSCYPHSLNCDTVAI